MTYVVDEKCIKCKTTDCVAVCPVDCFYEGENMLVIHPDECIDCGVCEPECPVDAIKPDTEPGLDKWLALNREYAQKWPNITVKKDMPRTPKPTGTRWGNSISTFRPGRVRATEQVYLGRIKKDRSGPEADPLGSLRRCSIPYCRPQRLPLGAMTGHR